MIEATSATFDELIKCADGPVIVDFWARWCGPCRPVRRELESLAAGETVVTVNADEEPEILRRFAVMSLPTLIAFVDGHEQERWVGWQGAGFLRRAIERYSKSD